MRTGCEVGQRLGRERELADKSLDRIERTEQNKNREREGEREREEKGKR